MVEKFRKWLVGFRKWSFAVLLLVITTGLICTGLLKSEDFASIWSAVGSAFMAANLAEHVLRTIRAKIAKPPVRNTYVRDH